MKDILEQAIVKVYSNDGSELTGWLFTNFGLVMTAGHGFSSSGEEEKQIQITLQGSDKMHNALLIESKFDLDTGIDYAILWIQDYKSFLSLQKKGLPLGKYKDSNAQNFYSMGYCHEISETDPVWLSGKVKGRLDRRNKKQWIQIAPDHSDTLNWQGVSGAPIIVDNHVVAIQSQQGEEVRTNGFCFATLVSQIDSEIVRKALHGGFEVSSSMENSTARKIDLYPQSREIKRSAFFLHKETTGIKIFKEFADVANLEKMCEEVLSSISLLHVVPNNNFDKAKFSAISSMVAAGDNVSAIVDKYGQQLGGDKSWLFNLRIVVDGNSGVFTIADDKWPELSNNLSHSIGIKIETSDTQRFLIYDDPKFDAAYVISGKPEFILKSVYNICADLLLDILIFYSVREFSNISSQAVKKMFSTEKVKFISARNNLIYGAPVPAFVHYVSFPSCARNSIVDAIDIQLLRTVWQDFINTYRKNMIDEEGHLVLISIINSITKNAIQTNLGGILSYDYQGVNSDEEIIGIITKQFKLLSGQTSESRVRNELSKIPASEKCLIFTMVVSKPEGKNVVKALRAAFGRPYKLKMVKFFGIKDLSRLKRLGHLLAYKVFYRR